jgi:two-component system OmpR family response regulator
MSNGADSAHILVVDDDVQLGRLVAKSLRADGYRVSISRNGAEMWETLRHSPVDLIVLDLMLPGRSGLELCKELRATRATPIVMLTAKGDEADRVLGLELGADDYLAKPFGSRELIARIKAVLRRAGPDRAALPAGAVGGVIEFDGWRLNTLRRDLLDPAGVAVDLTTGEYDLLLTFLEAPRRVLSREYLLDSARNREPHAFDRAIDVQISRLRRKLRSSDPDGGVIKTVRGAGYMMTAETRRE